MALDYRGVQRASFILYYKIASTEHSYYKIKLQVFSRITYEHCNYICQRSLLLPTLLKDESP